MNWPRYNREYSDTAEWIDQVITRIFPNVNWPGYNRDFSESISKWIDPVITWNFLNGIRMNYPGYKPGFPHDIWELNRPGYNRDFPEISEKGIDQVTIMYLRNELTRLHNEIVRVLNRSTCWMTMNCPGSDWILYTENTGYGGFFRNRAAWSIFYSGQ